ncbi:MAG: helix-turn-helix domain-containing protein [Defluviitaleaceae bacterium]|nr:helix-turn-helix domain-containing protein [Defluviitaleaceae bacterium]
MSELSISNIIAKKRRDKGITQEELAEYLGVSKAAVSKWEKKHSYPDITLLPQLATYFNVSIDELIGYTPQLTPDEIQQLCKKLSSEITNKPFDEAMLMHREAVKKYHSCFPFLFQVAALLINHHAAFSEEQRAEAINNAMVLFERIVAECKEVTLARDALNMQALCYILLGQPEGVFSLLGESLSTSSPYEEGSLIAQAFSLSGNKPKAKEIHQCNMYNFQHYLIETMVDYVRLIEDDFKTAQTAFNRAMEVIRLFNIARLNPNIVARAYLTGASMYCTHGDYDNALGLLENYLDFCTTKFLPFKFKGDEFFTDIDEWLNTDGSCESVIDEQAIKIAMLHGLSAYPAFELLKDNSRYKSIVKKLNLDFRR